MKYKAGDRVKIKSLDWYNENKDSDGYIPAAFFDELRYRFCGTIQTIANNGVLLGSGVIVYAIEDAFELIGEESIEGLAEEEGLSEFDKMYREMVKEAEEKYKTKSEYPETEDEARNICGDNRFKVIARAKEALLNSTNIETSEDEMKVLDWFLFRCWQMGWLERYDKPRVPLDIPTISTDFVKEQGLPCPDGYIFKDENGNVINATKIVLEKKKGYPKTCEECVHVLEREIRISIEQMKHFVNLLDADRVTRGGTL